MYTFLEYIQFHKIPTNILMQEIHPLGLVPNRYRFTVQCGRVGPHLCKVFTIELTLFSYFFLSCFNSYANLVLCQTITDNTRHQDIIFSMIMTALAYQADPNSVQLRVEPKKIKKVNENNWSLGELTVNWYGRKKSYL